MTERPLTNVAASVRQRLMNSARASGRPFQEVLQYFAVERFLYRLAQSQHAERFILKGALLFNLWGAPSSRATRDIDLLGRLNNTVDAVIPVFRDVCQLAVEPDGMVFAVETVTGQPIGEEAAYSGVRITFQASLENARVPMQIDIGFGDTVVPAAAFADYPTILDHAKPRLRAYPKETVVAEKFEAMVKLGPINSRLKDFFDLWLLSQQFEFDGRLLSEAIARTFENRRTAMSALPIALTAAFANDPIKAVQWKGFVRKSRLAIAPADFRIVVEALMQFLGPLAAALTTGQRFAASWHPHGPWQS